MIDRRTYCTDMWPDTEKEKGISEFSARLALTERGHSATIVGALRPHPRCESA